MDKERVKALLSLLDDPDEEICQEVITQLKSKGKELVPTLKYAVNQTDNNLVINRLQWIINDINFESFTRDLFSWLERPKDLLMLLIHIAKIDNPDINSDEIIEKCDILSRDIAERLYENLTAPERISIINYFLFVKEGIEVIPWSRQEPAHFMIDQFFKHKKCSMLFITIFYLIISKKIGIALYGINIPENNLLAFLNQTFFIDSTVKATTTPALFYINPGNYGSILGQTELENLLTGRGYKCIPSFFEPTNNIFYLKKLIAELRYIYEVINETDKVARIEHLSCTIAKYLKNIKK
ncbi:MAG: transglutaminase family protein [Bacteroidota bacterium]|nr:transglutaminase family protein [Bacteroidota bacterium]MDP4204928.1 transglutaminase family protein [Bacteroidota bacterium]